jgi:hypothetical protein
MHWADTAQPFLMANSLIFCSGAIALATGVYGVCIVLCGDAITITAVRLCCQTIGESVGVKGMLPVLRMW